MSKRLPHRKRYRFRGFFFPILYWRTGPSKTLPSEGLSVGYISRPPEEGYRSVSSTHQLAFADDGRTTFCIQDIPTLFRSILYMLKIGDIRNDRINDEVLGDIIARHIEGDLWNAILTSDPICHHFRLKWRGIDENSDMLT